MFIHIHPEGVPCPAKSGNHGAIIQGMAEDDSLFLPSHYNNGTVTPTESPSPSGRSFSEKCHSAEFL